jgi:hypothetical protein
MWALKLEIEWTHLLLSKIESLDLGMRKNTHNLAVFHDSLELAGDSIWSLGGSCLVLLCVMLEGSFLGLVPVTVESTLHFFTKMLSPDSGSI